MWLWDPSNSCRICAGGVSDGASTTSCVSQCIDGPEGPCTVNVMLTTRGKVQTLASGTLLLLLGLITGVLLVMKMSRKRVTSLELQSTSPISLLGSDRSSNELMVNTGVKQEVGGLKTMCFASLSLGGIVVGIYEIFLENMTAGCNWLSIFFGLGVGAYIAAYMLLILTYVRLGYGGLVVSRVIRNATGFAVGFCILYGGFELIHALPGSHLLRTIGFIGEFTVGFLVLFSMQGVGLQVVYRIHKRRKNQPLLTTPNLDAVAAERRMIVHLLLSFLSVFLYEASLMVFVILPSQASKQNYIYFECAYFFVLIFQHLQTLYWLEPKFRMLFRI